MKLIHFVAALPFVAACSPNLTVGRVMEAERARADAIVRRDAAAYDRLAADDLFIVDRDGTVQNQHDRMSAIDSGDAANARRIEGEIDVRVFGTVAILTGRSTWQDRGRQQYDVFSRIWAAQGGQVQLVAAHYTDITRQMTDDDPTTPGPMKVVPVAPDAVTPARGNPEEDVARAARAQHLAYWSKDQARYASFTAPDLIRVADNGVRTRDELITGMRANSRLPARPSDQFDIRVRVYGNTAIATWLDQGEGLLGNRTQLRFTVVFVHRAAGWQMVHIQSTGVVAYNIPSRLSPAGP